MEKTRTLPPLVRGRVTAVLDFFIDEISILTTSVLMDTFDLIVQVQWWGEDSPIYLRPKKAPFQRGKIRGKFNSVEIAKYEIKTTLELFKLYLKSCEVLELCILDIVKRCIIGSAFLRGLVNLLNQSNNFISAPVFDYAGEKIGQVMICFSFVDKPEQIVMKESEEICTLKNNHREKLGAQKSKISSRTKKSCYNPIGSSVLSNGCEEINFSELTPDTGMSGEKFVLKKNEKIYNDKASNALKGVKATYVNNGKVSERIYSCRCLPEISISNDSSKILYFGLSPQKNKQKISKTNTGMRNTLNSNAIISKSNSKSMENLSSFSSNQGVSIGQAIKKRPANEEVKSNQIKATEVEIGLSSLCKSFQSDEYSKYNKIPIKDVPSKQSTETKVLDFLLGADLSKEDEESAVNEFKKMSPSRNLVMSLNQLCLTSNSSESHNSRNRLDIDLSGSPGPTDLVFDLNNSIERNYYEKFFLKSEFLPDLELAEFLNQPEKNAVLEKLKSGENMSNKDVSQVDGFKSEKLDLVEKNRWDPKDRENYSEHYDRKDDAKGCARCKYYKKLDELDKIIESLKHFETKMLLHEKGLEWPLMESSEKYFTSQLDSS